MTHTQFIYKYSVFIIAVIISFSNVKAQNNDMLSGVLKYKESIMISNVTVELFYLGEKVSTTQTNNHGLFNLFLTEKLSEDAEKYRGVEVEYLITLNGKVKRVIGKLNPKNQRNLVFIEIEEELQILSGIVLDELNKPLQNINVVLTGNFNTVSILEKNITNDSGSFYFKLPIGKYNVNVAFYDENDNFSNELLTRYSLPSEQIIIKLKRNEQDQKSNIETSNLKIDDNIFAWDENIRKAQISIKNYSAIPAKNISMEGFLFYGKKVESIGFNTVKYIYANAVEVLKASLFEVPFDKKPDSIMVCLKSENENTSLKDWYQFTFKNVLWNQPGLETYGVNLIDRKYFQDVSPNCLSNSKDFELISQEAIKNRVDSLAFVKKIKLSAQTFVAGVNFQDLVMLKKVSTAKLYKYLENNLIKNYDYDLNLDIQILEYDNKKTYVKIFLSTDGLENSFAAELMNIYLGNKGIKNPLDSLGFLVTNASTFVGKLINDKGVWKFGIHEDSVLGKK